MKKTLLPLLLLICIALLFTPVQPVIAAETVSGTCGDNVSWELDEKGTLTISGTGKMSDFHQDYENGYWVTRTPWYEFTDSILSVLIAPGITHIGSYAFDDCAVLTNVTIPDTVISIGDYAFSHCKALTQVHLPASVFSLGIGVFCDSGLQEITLPEGITTLDWGVFARCSNLSTATLPNSLITIGEDVFADCSQLQEVVLPEGLVSIERSAFMNCASLTSVTFPSTLISIGDYAFTCCHALTHIHIPENLTSIGHCAFSSSSGIVGLTVSEDNPVYHSQGNCIIETESKTLLFACANSILPTDGSITRIGEDAFTSTEGIGQLTIPHTVSHISDGAFSHTFDIHTIIIPDSVTYLGEGAFVSCWNLSGLTLGQGITLIRANTFDQCHELEAIFYFGTKVQAEAVQILPGNETLMSATWHYEIQNANYLGHECYYCSECDAYFLPDGTKLCDHKYDAWTPMNSEEHQQICSLCNAEEISPHIPGPEATKTKPQSCTACGFILEPPLTDSSKDSSLIAVAAISGLIGVIFGATVVFIFTKKK